MSQPSPDRIIQIGMGFWPARTLQVAVKLGLFTELAKGPMTGEQMRQKFGLAPRAIPDFPDALVAIGFLDRQGDGTDALYSNGAEADIFLDKAKPTYAGGAYWRWPTTGSILFGETCWLVSRLANHKTKPSMVTSHCSRQFIPIPKNWRSSWLQ